MNEFTRGHAITRGLKLIVLGSVDEVAVAVFQG